ncbi:MAG TPA: GNAT family N-acetyltransferase [Methanofastidiosum sp.]|nr:GNAT family N-acetyltransferase [Methanofastidiosum sp.]HOC77666.1 GNAT family N-acetyltransferase [Methanofastidiosum sp.]HPA49700.1 GNAT family N-acetyltransferase [Methanofastidiosum sp.]HQK62599.1 GNAT family N-acetyltransferase [Methanofastidiosum sp.]HQQ49390.1 GNAT family N-acetyltransferase [Methanofastidiosum sp.]
MEIVKAKKAHAEKLSVLLKGLDTEEYSFSEVEKIMPLIESGNYFVAIDDNEIVGTIALVIVEESCEIDALITSKKGVGKALIEFAIDMCEKKGVKKIWCWSLKRYNAIGFYDKMGFKEQFLLEKQWCGEDCYIFGRVIE